VSRRSSNGCGGATRCWSRSWSGPGWRWRSREEYTRSWSCSPRARTPIRGRRRDRRRIRRAGRAHLDGAGVRVAGQVPRNALPSPRSAAARAGAAAPGATGTRSPRPRPSTSWRCCVRADSPEHAVEILDALTNPETASLSVKAAAAGFKFGPCTLEPSVIYMRTSGGLGAKPYTRCEVPVTSIRQDTDLRYKWGLWWRLARSYPGPGNQGQARYEQRNVQWICQGADSTTWAGTTVGTIVYGGETFYARVYQAASEQPCGV